MSSLVPVMSFANRMEAELAKSILDSYDVAAVVSSDDCGGMRPEIGFTGGGARLFVLEEDIGTAKEILESAAGSLDEA